MYFKQSSLLVFSLFTFVKITKHVFKTGKSIEKVTELATLCVNDRRWDCVDTAAVCVCSGLERQEGKCAAVSILGVK